MDYRYIGKSGLRVTPICLGTMTFGLMSSKEESFEVMDMAYERGINFFDTAELYPVPPNRKLAGITEEIIGEWMKERGIDRSSLIIASKVAGAASGWFVPPIRHGLTAIDRFHIKKALEDSLKRLKTDYIDLYQVHWPDPITPLEESLEVMDELIKEGKIRYIGTSNDTAYGLSKANEISRFKNLKRFESIQNNFSLLNRRFLDSISEVCQKENISLLPYSPIAGGVLSGKYQGGFLPPEARFTKYISLSDRQNSMAKRFVNDKTLALSAKYMELAKEIGITPVQLAVAWSMHFDFVASTIIGARNTKQLDEILGSFDIKLESSILERCDFIAQEILYPMG